jgi:hypothetical protein
MPIYREKKDKLSLKLSAENSKVTLTMNTYNGTESGLSWKFDNAYHNGKKGVAVELSTTSKLKGNTLKFNGSSNNPDKGKIKIEYVITEENGGSLVYIFPDDYTGDAAYDTAELDPSNAFQIKFF